MTRAGRPAHDLAVGCGADVSICDECLAEMTQLLRAEADKLAFDADKAAASPRLKVHADTLTKQSRCLGLAIPYIREIVRRQRVAG